MNPVLLAAALVAVVSLSVALWAQVEVTRLRREVDKLRRANRSLVERVGARS